MNKNKPLSRRWPRLRYHRISELTRSSFNFVRVENKLVVRCIILFECRYKDKMKKQKRMTFKVISIPSMMKVLAPRTTYKTLVYSNHFWAERCSYKEISNSWRSFQITIPFNSTTTPFQPVENPQCAAVVHKLTCAPFMPDMSVKPPDSLPASFASIYSGIVISTSKTICRVQNNCFKLLNCHIFTHRISQVGQVGKHTFWQMRNKVVRQIPYENIVGMKYVFLMYWDTVEPPLTDTSRRRTPYRKRTLGHVPSYKRYIFNLP